jgi:ABC-2 type transport system ATP-binding protein
MMVLELSGIEMKFSGVRALRGIDLALALGEVVGYVGPNGAGKTTTLNIASTLLRPSHGSVRLLGEDAFASVGNTRRLIGYMPEQFGVYDDMQVEEYLRFFAGAYHLESEKVGGIISEVLAGMDLASHAMHPIATLSKGMKQRLFFAKTLLHSPRLILLDEPFSGLDPMACSLVRQRIRAEAERGRGILIASHDLGELEQVTDRVVAIRGGLLVPVGDPDSADKRRRYELRCGGAAEKAAILLTARLGQDAVCREGVGTLLVKVADEAAAGNLLAELVRAKITVTSFAERQESLRDAVVKVFSERKQDG